MVGLELHRLEVLVLEDDVLLVLVLVALDQVGALDQPELGVDRLHVDPVVGVLVQLVEADALARARRRVEPHRAAHQAQLQISLPASPGRHRRLSSRSQPLALGAGRSRAKLVDVGPGIAGGGDQARERRIVQILRCVDVLEVFPCKRRDAGRLLRARNE